MPKCLNATCILTLQPCSNDSTQACHDVRGKGKPCFWHLFKELPQHQFHKTADAVVERTQEAAVVEAEAAQIYAENQALNRQQTALTAEARLP